MIDHFLHKASVLVVILLLTLASGRTWAQTGNPAMPPPSGMTPAATGDKVELIHADSLNVVNQPGAVVYRLIRNVKLQQKGVVLYCDLAIQNKTTNVIEAYGNVRMIQGDTINVRGDTLYYYGNTRQANVRGHVVLKDRKMTLNTAQLDYDMLSGLAHYPVKGRIVDRENILTSEEGDYFTNSKQFIFKRNVRLLNQPPGKEKTTILGDSLLYNSLSKIADFQGPTRIISKDGTLIARNGQYNTTTRISNFRQRATAETDKYTLTGDTLNFDNVNEIGVAHGNVVIVNKADKTTLTGDHGRYNGKAGVSRMIGHAVVRSPISQGADLDTLYMRADTLFSYDNKLTKKKKLIGQKNVLVYKSDLQSKCDSLVYDVNDSLLYFYKKPIVWSQNYQMEADSITARLKNNRINTMFLKSRSFVISQDTLLNFNQVKGRSITAYFRTVLAPVAKTGRPAGPITASAKNQPAIAPITTTTATAEKTTLDRVLVEGNGQTIYFAVDDKNRMVGMNRTECSKMNIEFTDSRVTRIRNYGRPDMYLTPPKELTDEKKQLDGFRWREKEKPTRAQTLGLTPPGDTKPAASTSVVAMVRDRVSTAGADLAQMANGLPANKAALLKSATPTAGKLETIIAATPAVVKPLVSAAAAPPKPARPISAPPEVTKLATSKLVAKPAADSVLTISIDKADVQAQRKPMLSQLVMALTPGKSTPLIVKKPFIAAKPTADQFVVVQPVAVSAVIAGESTGLPDTVAINSVEPAPAKPVVAVPQPPAVPDSVAAVPEVRPSPAKPIPDKTTGAAKPATASSSSSTLPTYRDQKQKKVASPLAPKEKAKTATTRQPTDESDLEKELNRKPKKP